MDTGQRSDRGARAGCRSPLGDGDSGGEAADQADVDILQVVFGGVPDEERMHEIRSDLT